MSLRAYLAILFYSILEPLDKAGATPKGLKITGVVVMLVAVAFWAGTKV